MFLKFEVNIVIKITVNAMAALADLGIKPIATNVIDCYKTIGIELPVKFLHLAGRLGAPDNLLLSSDTMLIKEWAQHTAIDNFNPTTDMIMHVDAWGTPHYFSVNV